jgi:hypothetical protein
MLNITDYNKDFNNNRLLPGIEDRATSMGVDDLSAMPGFYTDGPRAVSTTARAVKSCGPSGKTQSDKTPVVDQCEWIAYYCEACSRVQVYRGCFCGDRFECRFCRKKRIRRLQERYLQALYSFKWPSLLTLTLKMDDAELYRDAVKRLKECFRKLRQRKIWKDNVKAYFGAIELGKDSVHTHLIIDCVWMDHDELVEAWKQISGCYIVDIRRVQGWQRFKAIKEVFKYVVKDYDEDLNLDLVRDELKGVRLVVASPGLSLLDTIEISDEVICDNCGHTMKYAMNSGDFQEVLEYFRGTVYEIFVLHGGKWVKIDKISGKIEGEKA